MNQVYGKVDTIQRQLSEISIQLLTIKSCTYYFTIILSMLVYLNVLIPKQNSVVFHD